jgi:hypothetical protein
MNFDLWNLFLKVLESIRTTIPKVGAHLGVCVFIPNMHIIIIGNDKKKLYERRLIWILCRSQKQNMK